jgi:hypothetical protein
MRPAEEFSALVEEIACEMLHHHDRRNADYGSRFAKPRPKPWPSRFAVSQTQNETASLDSIQLGTETPISCAKVWKPFSKTAALILGT